VTAARATCLRLTLGWIFATSAAGWLTTTGPGRRVLLTVGEHEFTRLDLPVLPLLATAALLLVLSVVAKAPRAAWAATWYLSLAGALGSVGLWWLTSEPIGDRTTVVRVTPTHGLTLSDLAAAPTLAAATVCCAIGAVSLVRSLRPSDPVPSVD